MSTSKQERTIGLILDALRDHIDSLERVGFGSDLDISGADAVDAINVNFDWLCELLDRLDKDRLDKGE